MNVDQPTPVTEAGKSRYQWGIVILIILGFFGFAVYFFNIGARLTILYQFIERFSSDPKRDKLYQVIRQEKAIIDSVQRYEPMRVCMSEGIKFYENAVEKNCIELKKDAHCNLLPFEIGKLEEIDLVFKETIQRCAQQQMQTSPVR